MRLLLFCQQTGVRLDLKQSATECAALHGCENRPNCPLNLKLTERNKKTAPLTKAVDIISP